jgi:hypothetical protein
MRCSELRGINVCDHADLLDRQLRRDIDALRTHLNMSMGSSVHIQRDKLTRVLAAAEKHLDKGRAA